MPEITIKHEYDRNGNLVPALDSPLSYLNDLFQEAVGNVVGDGVANGTLLISIEVEAGKTLTLIETIISSKIAASTLYIVESDSAAVGGVETLLNVIDIPNVNTATLGNGRVPVAVINNTGATSLYLLIYAPQARGGAATNNAVTQYWSARAIGVIK